MEGDEFALMSLLADSTQSEILMVKYIGAALAHISNFYLLDIPDTRGSVTHPDPDDRLKSVIAGARLKDEADRVQLKVHISLGLQLFLNLLENHLFLKISTSRSFRILSSWKCFYSA